MFNNITKLSLILGGLCIIAILLIMYIEYVNNSQYRKVLAYFSYILLTTLVLGVTSYMIGDNLADETCEH